MRFFALGFVVAALTVAAELTAPTHAGHLLLYIGAGAAWAAAVLLARRLAPGRRDRAVILSIAIGMRIFAWLGPPAHSDDIHRYLWDGRVQRAGINPYLYTPEAPEVEHLRDENWSHVNNRLLPTIYPPLAQLIFRLTPSAAAWKALVALADLGITVLLMMKLPDPRRAIAWAWCPLAALELGLDAHVDAIAILLMLLALVATRRAVAGALLGAAAAVKLLPLALLPGLRSGRAIAAFAVVAIVLCLPFAGAGTRISGSLGEYGRRWRGNDGAYAVLYRISEKCVAYSPYRGRVEKKDSLLFRFITGRERDTIFPDEVASFAARAAAAALVLVAMAVAWGRPPLKFAEIVMGALILFTPTLHPWYVLWVVPFVAFGGSPAWLALAALAPLGYEPLGRWLAGGAWQDPVWTRLLEHGLTWSLLLVGLIPAKRPLLSSDP